MEQKYSFMGMGCGLTSTRVTLKKIFDHWRRGLKIANLLLA